MLSRAEHVATDLDDRLHRFEEVTDPSLAHLEHEDLLLELLDRVRDLLNADTAAVLLLDSSGSLVATAARGIEEEVRQGVRIPLGQGFAGRIAAEKRPVILDRVTRADVANPLLWEKGIKSLLGAPLLVSGKVIGVLKIGTLTARRFTESDSKLLQLVADRIALITQSQISMRTRAAALSLQRSLLPAQLPTIDGIEFAARYVAGGHGDVGGDWYDVFRLASDKLCVVVGDVVGNGLDAAITMGRLRDVLRAHALGSEDPAVILDLLDRYVRHFDHSMAATVVCGIADPSHRELLLSSAGHLPPVFARPGMPAELLHVPPDPPLGVRTDHVRRTSSVRLPPNACIGLYTDGLVERRDETIDDGLKRLCDAMSHGPAETVCAHVMSQLVGTIQAEDDIALLVMGLRPAPAS